MVEQESSQTQHTEKVLLKYKNILHKIHKSTTDVFNKSVLINLGAKQGSGTMIWILDCDVYLNYGAVTENITDECDFIRPFLHMTLLDEVETNHLFETRRLKMTEREYKTNDCDGKYSFVVKRDIFDLVGGMNEDFEGWGFQDLDFVKRLPQTITKCHLNNIGFHLYHDPAKRTHIKRNRALYTNYGGTLQEANNYEAHEYKGRFEAEQPTKKKEPKRPNVRHHPPTNIKSPKITPTSPQVSSPRKVKPTPWEPPTSVFFHRGNKSSMTIAGIRPKYNQKVLQIKDTTQPLVLGTTGTGVNKATMDTRPYMFWYFSHIIDTYDKLSGTIMFLNDSMAHKHTEAIEKDVDKINSRLYRNNGYRGFSTIGNANTGNFIITSQTIKKHPREYYVASLRKMRRWSTEKYRKFSASLGSKVFS